MGARPDGAILEALQQKVDRGLPGAFVIIEEADGTTDFITAGVADMSSGRSMFPEDHYRVGSTTKTFVAVVVLQLVAEDRLSLSDLVARRLTGYSVPNGDTLTVEHLLRMRSGLFDFVDAPALHGLEVNLKAHSLDESIALGLGGEPIYRPGQRSTYCNTNFLLLERIVEQLTGSTLAEQFRQRIIEPVGLTETTYPPEDDLSLPEPYIRGYDFTGERWQECSEVYFGRGDGAVISTAVDIAKFFRSLFRGDLLPNDLLRSMQTIVHDDPPPQYAYGMGLIADPLPIGTVWGHSGRGFGYGHHPFMDLESGRFVIWMLNGTRGYKTHRPQDETLVRFAPEARALAYK